MYQIQHLNLGIARFEEGLPLLAIYEEVRSNLGNVQGPASADIWPRASVTRFLIQKA